MRNYGTAKSQTITNVLSIVFIVAVVGRGHLLGTNHSGAYIATLV